MPRKSKALVTKTKDQKTIEELAQLIKIATNKTRFHKSKGDELESHVYKLNAEIKAKDKKIDILQQRKITAEKERIELEKFREIEKEKEETHRQLLELGKSICSDDGAIILADDNITLSNVIKMAEQSLIDEENEWKVGKQKLGI
jgi:hypothetical protein